jgi:TetR/AcrR family transcriptional repressor of nem operon
MGRTSTAREQLIDSVRTLMHARGYGAIGVAEICERADVRKGSFYYFFESKQALTIAALQSSWAEDRARWLAALGNRPGIEGLEDLVRQQVDIQRGWRESSGTVIGCLYGNLALEAGADEPELRAVLRGLFEDQSELVRASLEEAADAGQVPKERATVATARGILAQLEGAVMFARLFDDPSELDNLWLQIQTLLVPSAPSATRA